MAASARKQEEIDIKVIKHLLPTFNLFLENKLSSDMFSTSLLRYSLSKIRDVKKAKKVDEYLFCLSYCKLLSDALIKYKRDNEFSVSAKEKILVDELVDTLTDSKNKSDIEKKIEEIKVELPILLFYARKFILEGHDQKYLGYLQKNFPHIIDKSQPFSFRNYLLAVSQEQINTHMGDQVFRYIGETLSHFAEEIEDDILRGYAPMKEDQFVRAIHVLVTMGQVELVFKILHSDSKVIPQEKEIREKFQMLFKDRIVPNR